MVEWVQPYFLVLKVLVVPHAHLTKPFGQLEFPWWLHRQVQVPPELLTIPRGVSLHLTSYCRLSLCDPFYMQLFLALMLCLGPYDWNYLRPPHALTHAHAKPL